jgi:hypothetical protein
MTPSPKRDDPGLAAACIADICAALQTAELVEERTRVASRAVIGARLLDARLAQIQAALDRIEARLGEVEHELVLLTRPSWPF